MGNLAGEQGHALQQLLPYKSSHSFTNSDRHKIPMMGDLKLYYNNFDILLTCIW